MLTPKRLLLSFGGFGVLFVGFLLYSHFLGHYDGLQPLPADYRPGEPTDAPLSTDPGVRLNNSTLARLEEAFGKNCDEVNRRMKLLFPTQGVVMAADGHKLEDGKLKLTKVSVAHFGKADSKGRPGAINTIRGDLAIIEFDKPLTDVRDYSSRKPIAGIIKDNVRLHNNRQTPDPKDDIRLFTKWLAYRDDQHRIWTDSEVVLTEQDPEQRTVKATGLEVILIPGEVAATTKGGKPTTRPTITGVKHLRLERDVQMTVLLDGDSTFLGGQAGGGSPKPAASTLEAIAQRGVDGSVQKTGTLIPPKPVPQTPVVVNCQGPFVWHEEGEHDRAEFHDKVTVIRTQEEPSPTDPTKASPRYDQLDCDKLVLTFSRKKGEPRRVGSENPGEGVDLVTAHASGKQVVLVSDAEKLHATATDMIYEKATNTTTLRGDPVIAEQAGHVLHLRGALMLRGTPGGRELQEARAQGPGEIRLRRENHPEVYARWREELVSVKENGLDRLTMRGQASFEDPLRGILKGDELSVWIDPTTRLTVKEPKRSDTVVALPAGARDRAPRRLEARGNVSLTSAELLIPRTDRLSLQFEPGKLPPPLVKPTETPRKVEPATPAAVDAKPSLPAAPRAPEPPGQKPQFLPTADVPRKQPLELAARSVDAIIVYEGNRAELKKLDTEGQVRVIQKAATPTDKAVDIKADRLTLRGTPDGYVAEVFGRPGEPAFVQLDRLSIMGPTVNVSQPANEATVEGVGSMKLPSKNDFQGNALKEPLDVTIFWTKRMYFNGTLAEFDDSEGGGVVAMQGPARLACRTLQVILDNPVSLRGREKGQPEPGLHRLLCDGSVRLERGIHYDAQTGVKPAGARDVVALDKDGRPRWREFQRIEAAELAFERSGSNKLDGSGPGIVTLLGSNSRPGLPGAGPPRPNAPPGAKDAPPAPEELRVTRIHYSGHLDATQVGKEDTIIKFIDNVELFYLPATDPDVIVDANRLPSGAVHVQCGQLRVRSRKVTGERTTNDFEAKDRVRVRANEFHAFADRVTYDESKDLLILEGLGNNSATLYRQSRPGAPREPFSGKKLMHWVKENRTDAVDADFIRFKP
jgi:lipopolysaccharide export system protein LptA